MTYDYHVPALVEEVLSYLELKEEGVYVDATLGGGGHAEQMLRHLSPQGKLIGFDADADAISHARQRLVSFGERVSYIHDNFSNIQQQLHNHQITAIDGVLMDLGVSSYQIDEASRGFSFQRHGRLDMRMDQRQVLDGRNIVNTYDERQLAEIFWKYGEERNARRIAKNIVLTRERQPIDTTEQLAEIVGTMTGQRFLQKSLARIFQAIRIEVNRELDRLQSALQDVIDVLRPGGRVVVISYHSLEDRIVKDVFRENSRTMIPSKNKLEPDVLLVPKLRLLTRKPVEAGERELAENPRARSAKLRAAERI